MQLCDRVRDALCGRTAGLRVVRILTPSDRRRAQGFPKDHVPRGDTIDESAFGAGATSTDQETRWCALQVGANGLPTLKGPCLWELTHKANATSFGTGCILPLPPPLAQQGSILVGVVSSSSAADQTRLLGSMQSLRNSSEGGAPLVDWAVLTYDGDAHRWGDTMRAARHHRVRLTVVNAVVPPDVPPPAGKTAGAYVNDPFPLHTHARAHTRSRNSLRQGRFWAGFIL